jgi:hypothetical protein
MHELSMVGLYGQIIGNFFKGGFTARPREEVVDV